MKSIGLFLIAPLLLASCTGTSEDSIAGVYLREWTNEFGKVSDTLRIERHESGNYSVLNTTTHFRSAEGMAPDTNRERTRYTGIYNTDSRAMQLDDPGMVLSFDADGSGLTVEGIKHPYKKIE